MGFGNRAMIRGFVQYTKLHRRSEEEEQGGQGENDVDNDVEERRGRGRKKNDRKIYFLLHGGMGIMLRYFNNVVRWE